MKRIVISIDGTGREASDAEEQVTVDEGEETNRRNTQARLVHVAVDDEVSDRPPLVHHRVRDRMEGRPDYAPRSLESVGRDRVLEEDLSVSA